MRDQLQQLDCAGCGMEDPMGYHYEDCPLVDETDLGLVPRNFTGHREDAARPVPPGWNRKAGATQKRRTT